MVVHRDFEPDDRAGGDRARAHHRRLVRAGDAGPDPGARGRERFDLSSFRWCIGGGERTPEARIRAFAGCFHNARYIDGYGLTETMRRRHADGGRPRDREDRLDRPRAGARRDHDPRQRRQRAAGGREGEICLRGPKVLTRLLERSGEDRREFLRRLVPHRRRRLPRCGRLPVPHRSQEGHDHQRRREHCVVRGRAGDLPAAAGRRVRGDRSAGRALGRAPGRGRRAAGRRLARPGRARRALSRPPRRVQGAGSN